MPRTKAVNPRACLYTELKWPCEVVSGSYISGPAMLIAAQRLGLQMQYTVPTGETAYVNLSQYGVNALRARAEEIMRRGVR
jgi:hypothetical protein